jgi:2-dehydropantoate 2-reductase
MIQKAYLSGLGAIGSAYAARIYASDPQSVAVIADQARIERYRREGVAVNGQSYPFHYVLPEGEPEPADIILIAVKQHHLKESIVAIRRFVGPQTIILSLLNGITSESIIGEVFGMEKLLYAFVVGTDATREGTSTQYSNLGKIVFGERINREYSPKVQAVKDFFDRTGVPYQIPVDMQRELWWKFMLNVGINQTSAILRAGYGPFQEAAEARDLMISACREVVRISEKEGINLTDADIDRVVQIINTLDPNGKTSMCQDVEAGRKTEVEIFAGTVLEFGRKYGIPTPVNEVLWRMLKTIEKMR